MLKTFYITNNSEIAVAAEQAGVDRIFIDMEYIGKDERQYGLDTVKNHHTIDDVKKIKNVLTKSKLLVRVNPVNSGSKSEIDAVIAAGADYIMLPMWKSAEEVKTFISLVNARTKTILLLETEEARICLDEALKIDGIDEVYIGLNDLHLSQHKKFMFELLTDGTVDEIVSKLKKAGIPFGIGGVGKINENNPLPAENILCEHYRLGSSMVILARAFLSCENINDFDAFAEKFKTNLFENKQYEKLIADNNNEFFKNKHIETAHIIEQIVKYK